MNNERTHIEAQLQRLTNDWAGLQAVVAQREQEIQQIDRRRAQLAEEILRQQGAMAYNQILAESVRKQLVEIEKVVSDPAVSA